MVEFNNIENVGSLYEKSVKNKRLEKFGYPVTKSKKIVNIISYCLNPNHFHFLIERLEDCGISEFMKKLSGGYSYYFNNKREMSGALFQGNFKVIHVANNNYLLNLSAYVNYNFLVHSLKKNELYKSSIEEFTKKIQ